MALCSIVFGVAAVAGSVRRSVRDDSEPDNTAIEAVRGGWSMWIHARRLSCGSLGLIVLALTPGCIIKVPITDTQSVLLPQGTFDASIGEPGQQVFHLTVPITSLCSLPTANDVITEFLESGQGLPVARFLLEADHAWAKSFTFKFDGANFEHNAELTVRVVGPDGEWARRTVTEILPIAGLTLSATPTSQIDILQVQLPPGECLDFEFILTGRNPSADVSVEVRMELDVELHTRGFIDAGLFLQ